MKPFLLKSSDQSVLAAAIRTAVGADATEDVEVMTPQFDRPSNWEPVMIAPGADVKAWSGFQHASREILLGWGCRCFCRFTTELASSPHVVRHVDAWFRPTEDDEPATHELTLFPAEWHASIPAGFPLVDINGCLEAFEPGKTDDDRRFGMLAYGVMIPLAHVASEEPPA